MNKFNYGDRVIVKDEYAGDWAGVCEDYTESGRFIWVRSMSGQAYLVDTTLLSLNS